jgi:glucose-6-phosphate-specific signal transduction histidine kinase
LAQSILAEALRNIAKHARPTHVEVVVTRDAETFTFEVRNDGISKVAPSAAGAGMGLRLAAFEALQHGGVVESGPTGPDTWRVRLAVRLEQEAE